MKSKRLTVMIWDNFRLEWLPCRYFLSRERAERFVAEAGKGFRISQFPGWHKTGWGKW